MKITQNNVAEKEKMVLPSTASFGEDLKAAGRFT
jgi:hypothetical protein